MMKTFIRRLLNRVYCIHHSNFKILEVILHQLDVQLRRYGGKRLFAGFEIVLTAFNVVFLEL